MKDKIEEMVGSTISQITSKVEVTTSSLDRLIDPARSTFAKRYPGLFAILVTVGLVMTFLGIEQLLLTFDLLERYPILILVSGLSILVLTGTLYKKLS